MNKLYYIAIVLVCGCLTTQDKTTTTTTTTVRDGLRDVAVRADMEAYIQDVLNISINYTEKYANRAKQDRETILPKISQKNMDAVREFALNITSGQETSYQKSRAIYKWVALNTEYVIESPRDYSTEVFPYTAAEMLQRRRGQCADASVLMATLLEAVGEKVVILTTMNHAFVAVRVDKHFIEELRKDYNAKGLPGYRLFSHDGEIYLPIEATGGDHGELGETYINGPYLNGTKVDDEIAILDIEPTRNSTIHEREVAYVALQQ